MTRRCISGSWLGEAHHCVNPAVPNLLGDPMFCVECEASIAGVGPLCDCPGCSLPYIETETTTMTDNTTSIGETTDHPHAHRCNACGYTGRRRPRIEIYPYDVAEGADPEHGFRLRAGNGEIVMHGEGYGRPDAAEARARAIVIDGAYANASVVHLDETGETVAESPLSTEVDPVAPAGVLGTAPLPEVWEDEEGGVWWAKGHHHPAAMALAVVADVAAKVGPIEAQTLVAPDVDELDAEAEGVKPGRHPERANDLLRNVHHVWMRPDPNNPDERIVPATLGDPDGAPWTQLELV